MAKEPPKIGISGYYVPDFNNKIDPSRLIIEQIINTSSGRTSNVDGGLKLLTSNKGYKVSDSLLTTGKIEQIGRSIRVPEELYIKVGDKLVDPYPKGVELGLSEAYDAEGKYTSRKSTLSSTTFMELLEQMGLVENRPVPAPRKNKRHKQKKGIVSGIPDVEDRFSFTPKFYDAVEKIKTADSAKEIGANRGLSAGKPLSIMQVLEDVGAFPKPTALIEGAVDEDKSKRRPVGRASAAAQETRAAAIERKKEEAAKAAANIVIREAKEEGVIGPKTAERFSVPELPEPEPEPEKLTNQQALDRILNDPREAQLVEQGKLRSETRARERFANMPLRKAEGIAGELVKGDAGALEKMGQFLSKNKGKIIKSIAPAVIGGGIGLAAKGAEALDYAMSSKPTGRDPESMSTQQMEALLASVKGGDLTDEQRLATAEMPPEARQAEYLEKQLAERARPMEQGAAMQEDIQRSTRFQDEMKRLMLQQQQKQQGIAQ